MRENQKEVLNEMEIDSTIQIFPFYTSSIFLPKEIEIDDLSEEDGYLIDIENLYEPENEIT